MFYTLTQTGVQITHLPSDGSLEIPEPLQAPALTAALQGKRFRVVGDSLEVEPDGRPVKPGTYWDFDVQVWVDPRTLDDIKTQQWSQIKAARDAAEHGGFTWGDSPFDSDPISQSRIQGAAQLATLATMSEQPFSIDWTLADNTVRTLDAQEMIAVGMALGEHINACHEQGRILRAQLESATTPEEVEAVVWGSLGTLTPKRPDAQ